jgi:L-fuculose-phosphate aldolase
MPERGEHERTLRAAIVSVGRALLARDLTAGRSGNVSARFGDGFLVTPSGVPYEAMRAEDIVALDAAGRAAPAAGPGGSGSGAGALAPSSEWRLHAALYRERPDAMAIVHAHSPYATALACQRRGIPAFHYMVAVAGGEDIRCATYATFGSPELAQNALDALRGRRACLLANHGTVALAATPAAALELAAEVEALARQYLVSLAAGGPVILSAEEMRRVLLAFRTYGQPAAEPPVRD